MNITTLDQAASHLMEVGAVDTKTMMVEGRRLLEVCGLDAEKAAQSIARQIDKHGFEVEKDFCTSMGKSTGGRAPTVYHFTLNAANHVLLAAMTEKGKVARQDAIDMKLEQQYQIPQTYAAALLEAGRLAMELEQSQAQLAIAAPKADVFDRVIEREALLNATQVAQQIGMSAIKMNRKLDELGGVYNKCVKRGRAFCHDWVLSGYGEMKITEMGYPQPLFTTKGSLRVAEIFTSEGVV